jgi:hypothetical protein
MADPTNPYAPPAAPDDPWYAGPAPARLAPDVEARAMELLGKLRSRTVARSFAVGWMASMGGLMAVVGMGLIPALIVGSLLGGAISKAYCRWRRPALAEKVCRQLGIDPRAFAPDRYLID